MRNTSKKKYTANPVTLLVNITRFDVDKHIEHVRIRGKVGSIDNMIRVRRFCYTLSHARGPCGWSVSLQYTPHVGHTFPKIRLY